MTAFISLSSIKALHPEENLKCYLQKTLSEAYPRSQLLLMFDPQWAEKITLLDLLTHRSGLSDYVPLHHKELNAPLDTFTLIHQIQFNPEKSYLYSNSNYLLLARLIEEETGESFEELFNNIIKEPAKMTSTYAPKTGNYQELKNEPRFTALQPNLNQEIFIDMANTCGAGGVISTANDLVKWNRYLYYQTDPEIRDVLLTTYFSIGEENHHLGLTSEPSIFGNCFGHQGGIDSYRSFLGFIPSSDLHIVILSNNTEDFNLCMKALFPQ